MASWRLSLLIILLSIWAIAGCGSSGTVARVTVSPSTATVGAQQTQQYFSAAYDSAGNALARSFTWSVTGSVGTIDATSGLFYAGTSFGSGSISATADNVSGSATIAVANNGTLTGRLTDASLNRVANIRVSLTTVPTFSATSDSNGTYAIYNIPAGTYEVKTTETTVYLSLTAEVLVPVASTTTQNFTLSPRLAIASENETRLDNAITITGVVRNNGTTTAKGVSVIYQYFNEEGAQIGGNRQILGDISGLGASNFSMGIGLSESSYARRNQEVICTSYLP